MEEDAAERFRSGGFEVALPDLYAGKRTDSLDEGFQLMAEIGWPVICWRAFEAMRKLPDSTISAGFSMGAGVIASLWGQRPESKAVLLFHGLAEIPRSVRPGLKVQTHTADVDRFVSAEQKALWAGSARTAGLKRANKSYHVDETYIKVKAQNKYLYRAVDSTGQTIDFLLTAKRDTAAAKGFFEKVFSSSSNPIPRVINVDKDLAYPAAVEVLKAEGTLPRRVRLRQCKYLNNVIEQDHRNRQKADLVGKRLRLLSKCLPNSRRNRNDEHDPQGPS